MKKRIKTHTSSALLKGLVNRFGLKSTTRSINTYRQTKGLQPLKFQTVDRYANGYVYALPYHMRRYLKMKA